MFDVRCKHGFSFNSRLTLNVSEKSRIDWWIEQASIAAQLCAGKPPGGLHSPMGIRVSVSEERESIYDHRKYLDPALIERRYNSESFSTSPDGAIDPPSSPLVSVTDDAGNFPGVTSFPPDHGELEYAAICPTRTGTFFILCMAKNMLAESE